MIAVFVTLKEIAQLWMCVLAKKDIQEIIVKYQLVTEFMGTIGLFVLHMGHVLISTTAHAVRVILEISVKLLFVLEFTETISLFVLQKEIVLASITAHAMKGTLDIIVIFQFALDLEHMISQMFAQMLETVWIGIHVSA